MYFLEQLQINLEKKARFLEEPQDQFAFLKQHEGVRLESHPLPFRHVVIDSFFPEALYHGFVDAFTRILEKGVSKEKDPERFSLFHDVVKPYDGYVCPILPGISTSTDILYSYSWNRFWSTLFHIPTYKATSAGFHYHPTGDKTGWVHSDYSLKQFHYGRSARNGMLMETEGDAPDGNGYKKLRRGIALLFYLNNENTDESGGTALFKEEHGEPIKIITPKNNRMLAFEITPVSFHAFQTNSFPRHSFVQWFFVDPRQKPYSFVSKILG